MRLVPRVATAATTLPVDKAAAKQHCRIEHDEDDAEIEAFIGAAFDYLQPPFGCLRVSVLSQVLRADLPCWPACALELPLGPVTAIGSVKYFDASNVEQTIDSSAYFLDNDVLMFAETFSAPSIYARPSAVRITYTAGYADAAAVPRTLKNAILQCVAHWYENREAVQAVGPLSMMPLGFDDLIASYRMR